MSLVGSTLIPFESPELLPRLTGADASRILLEDAIASSSSKTKRAPSHNLETLTLVYFKPVPSYWSQY